MYILTTEDRVLVKPDDGFLGMRRVCMKHTIKSDFYSYRGSGEMSADIFAACTCEYSGDILLSLPLRAYEFGLSLSTRVWVPVCNFSSYADVFGVFGLGFGIEGESDYSFVCGSCELAELTISVVMFERHGVGAVSAAGRVERVNGRAERPCRFWDLVVNHIMMRL